MTEYLDLKKKTFPLWSPAPPDYLKAWSIMRTRTISNIEARPAPSSSDSASMSQWEETMTGRSSGDSQWRPGRIPMMLTPLSCIVQSRERVRIYTTRVLPH